MRWRIAFILSVAIAISYLDRQALLDRRRGDPEGHPAHQYRLRAAADRCSSPPTALMYAGGGALIDRLGTRRGFLVIMVALVARLRQPRRWRRGFWIARAQPVPARRRRRRRLPRRDQGRRRVVSRARTLDGDGHHQRRHGGRRRRRAAGSSPRSCSTADWRWVFFTCGAAGLLWTVVVVRVLPLARRPPRLSAAERALIGDVAADACRRGRRAIPGSACCAFARSGDSSARSSSPTARGSSTLLAAEVSLRRARLRREAGRLLRVDSVCRGRHRQPDRRLVLELAPHARPVGRRRAQDSRSAPARR